MIEHVPTSILSEERCHLGEGPTYDATTDTAWWFDILEGRLFEARLASGQINMHQLGRMASALACIDAQAAADRRGGWSSISAPSPTVR